MSEPIARSSSAKVFRLRELLNSCSQSIEEEEIKKSVADLVDFLSLISEDAAIDPDNVELKNEKVEVLSEIYTFLSSSSLEQVVADALSFELPKAVSKFAWVSDRCLEIADSIVDLFIATCSPRDMLSILCEALDSRTETVVASSYIAPLLHGLSKVFLSTKRRHFEQVKVALPIILKILKDVCLEAETELEELFDRAIRIADSIRDVCLKLEGKVNEKLRALLGLYVLEIMVIISLNVGSEPTSCLPLVLKLAHFFPFCELSYLGLLTGYDVDQMTSIVVENEEDDYMIISFLSEVRLGAALSVIWGKISDAVAQAAKADLSVVEGELQSNRIKRWQAISMLKHIISCANLSWELRRHCVYFLLCITSENTLPKDNEEHIDDYSAYMPSLYSSLQAKTQAIIYAPDTALKMQTFEVFKRILADIPKSHRFEILKALITNSNASSMTAILLDLVRGNMHRMNSESISNGKSGPSQADNCVCTDTFVLELVEAVLRPSTGGPPSLPEQGDLVLSALNLYRFALLIESRGENNCKGVLVKNNLRKAYDEWLLPLRTLVSRIMAENKSEHDHQLAIETECSLNPLELVLYRCIELVEEKLKS